MSEPKMQVTGSSEERGRRETRGFLLFGNITCANGYLLIPENEDIEPLRNGGILLPAGASICQSAAACPPLLLLLPIALRPFQFGLGFLYN